MYRSLAEDIFIYEDTIAELRKPQLITAMTSVIVSAPILERLYAKSVHENQTMAGKTDLVALLNLIRVNPHNEGWLARWILSLGEWKRAWTVAVRLICLDSLQISNKEAQAAEIAERLMVDILNTLSVFLDWAVVPSLLETSALDVLLDLILTESLTIKLVMIFKHLILNRRL